MEKIEIYTDGSCRKNPGPGGFGVICFNENKIIQVIKKQNSNITTNNREELKAILTAFKLSQTKYKNKICIIYSDSAYCVNICNDWIYTWARNGWKNSKKKEIENIDLIKELYNYINIDFFNCQVRKCRGHANNIKNELADALATNNIKKFSNLLKDCYYDPVERLM